MWIMKNITENTESELISLMDALQQLETALPTDEKNMIFSLTGLLTSRLC